MPRFLWLGLILCAIGLLAALVFVRGGGPTTAIDPLAEHVVEPSDPPREELLGSSDASTVERVAAVTGTEQRSASSPEGANRDVPPRRGHVDFGVGERPPPAFEAGVIEARVVRDHDGRPMAGVNVALGREWSNDVQTTDSNGVVVFTNVGEGVANLSAILAGHARVVGQAWISPESPHRNVELRLVVERDVVVRIQDPNGRTFDPDAWQLARRAANRIGIRLDTRCGRMGSTFEAVDVIQFSSRSVEPELGPFTWRLRIQGSPDVCVHALLDEVIIGMEPLGATATELHVRLDPTAIEAALAPALVRVLADGKDAPIAGALVEFNSAGPKAPKFHTGIDGRVRVSMVGAPSPQLVVSASGYATVRLALTRPHPPEFVVRLPAGRRIAGRVVDQDGSPLAAVRVELRAGSGDATKSPSTISRKGGSFEFADVAAGEYRVLATHGVNRVEGRADCRERDAIDVELEIPVSKGEPSPTPR